MLLSDYSYGHYVLVFNQRLLTDESPRLREALRYTIYGKSGVFDAERFIDVMQAFENFVTAARSGGGENLNGNMADLGIIQNQSFIGFESGGSALGQPIKTRAALAFLLLDRGNFFREFLLDELTALLPTITDEDKIILNNVQKIVEFLTAGTADSRKLNQAVDVVPVIQVLLPVWQAS
ncbi:hypothetical protein Sjap_008389 [Stephania japonica]|uniref:Uncharacterized protein n=1 Tax=Stephania japonica TaxID=461633 RepID=A0AAP0JQ85_9MAGN